MIAFDVVGAPACLSHRLSRFSHLLAPIDRRRANAKQFTKGWEFVGFPTMTRVYVGNLDPRVSYRDLEDEFRMFGVLHSVWVARMPPGYAFIEFDDHRDALDAIQRLDGKNGWRVELSHNSKGYAFIPIR